MPRKGLAYPIIFATTTSKNRLAVQKPSKGNLSDLAKSRLRIELTELAGVAGNG